MYVYTDSFDFSDGLRDRVQVVQMIFEIAFFPNRLIIKCKNKIVRHLRLRLIHAKLQRKYQKDQVSLGSHQNLNLWNRWFLITLIVSTVNHLVKIWTMSVDLQAQNKIVSYFQVSMMIQKGKETKIKVILTRTWQMNHVPISVKSVKELIYRETQCNNQ